ncbi:adenylosuccinate lyase [Heliophilum fasciatum]|uniref:Adenylosuccinate lyase n=1 Tax=Heliophilum fasciatum TaxID=35700 RepID=A0A4V6NRM1_9FIRM|nr:adenylosuccinate lyase [Heliophilum fasciatum]MCW2278632.1 adenylosuccinate lyase [Heliophilum fasciatum]TCP62666.1 adenylosuccinate lyase [Heliophilum fasciatum]
MIDRYTLPEMGAIWAAENRFQKWLDVEVAACEALTEQGKIPREAYEVIREKAAFNVDRINEIEEITKHDVLAFLTCVAEYIGEESKYVHMGMTSSDVLDTALSLQMKEAGAILVQKLKKLREVIAERAKEHKYTVMVGRTHGIHAEPVTFGLKLALWYDEVGRCIKRMNAANDIISVGAISGAVGTFAQIDPSVEEFVCQRLGLKPAPISTQVIQRDRHAEYMATIAVIGSSLEKFATELRNLQRTDIHEVEEAFSKGQKGSSAMPHKKNPITSERVAGLSRVLRGNALAAMENVALWHERDITHSSVERVIIPDSTILLDYMLAKMIEIVANLQVFPEAMQANLDKTLGLVNSQRVMLALVDKGVLRETAYHLVQRNALKAWEVKRPFKELVKGDADIMDKLSVDEVEGLFDYDYHIKHVDTLFKRVGL